MKGVKYDFVEAELFAAAYLRQFMTRGLLNVENRWVTRLLEAASQNRIILRPLVLSKEEVLRHLPSLKDWDGNRIQTNVIRAIKEYAQADSFWLVEISVQELFSANLRKLGEVLLNAAIYPSPLLDYSTLCYARIVDMVFILDIANERILILPTGISGHVAMFRCEQYGS